MVCLKSLAAKESGAPVPDPRQVGDEEMVDFSEEILQEAKYDKCYLISAGRGQNSPNIMKLIML